MSRNAAFGVLTFGALMFALGLSGISPSYSQWLYMGHVHHNTAAGHINHKTEVTDVKMKTTSFPIVSHLCVYKLLAWSD